MAMNAAAKFDAARAGDYAAQSRIALAGYEACHALAACLLAATLDPAQAARILVAGVGGGAQEIVAAAPLAPAWRFTGVDPSPPMLDAARAALVHAGLADRAALHLGTVDTLPEVERFDAATLVGVLHHLPGDAAKRTILAAVAARLPPGAPFVLACNRGAYAGEPDFLAAWSQRWRMHGESAEGVERRLGTILHGVDPPASDEAVAGLLAAAGFGPPRLFFSSLFWGGWITRRRA